ncbi:MAG: alpha/beta fold hydrolase [Phycisphaerales bacterium]|nr:alpha/beta fold hydrolase [Phycisphaerales bacterium]
MTGADTGPAVRRRAWWRRWWVWYVLLVIASHLAPVIKPPAPGGPISGASRSTVGVESGGRPAALSYLEWRGPGGAGPPPVILLHGSPGAAEDFARLGPALALDRRVIAVDQLGFGESAKWVPDYSIRANARAALELMDRLGISRAHIVGWSNGGGTVLNMADIAPERIASMTMMAAIGDQLTEGSQSYFFEHAKYRIGLAATYGAELIPHFGLLGPLAFRHASIRFFSDSDQRPLSAVMATTRVPTLILHGRHDFLVPAWAAERHHAQMPASRLIMLDASHFLPFIQVEEAARHLNEFFREHDEPGRPARTDTLDLAPLGPARGIERWTRPGGEWLRRTSWVREVAMLAALSLLSPALAAAVGAVFVHDLTLNFSVLALGLAAGRMARVWSASIIARAMGERVYGLRLIGPRLAQPPREDWKRRWKERPWRTGWLAASFRPLRREAGLATGLLRRPPARFMAGYAAGVLAASYLAALGAVAALVLILGPLQDRWGWPGALIGLMAAFMAGRHAPSLITRMGRQRLRAYNARVLRREYWPAFVYYLPLAPYLIYLGLRHRGLTVPTCVNPGIEAGGGMVGESKHEIMQKLGAGRAQPPPGVLTTVLIEDHPETSRRIDQVLEAMRREPSLAAFPVLVKPDSGQRGFGVKIVHSREDLAEYFREMTRPAIVQPYHPGPGECGVLWVRRLETVLSRAPRVGPTGFVYSVTAKDFPEITGDGRRTLEQLIYAHRRYRRQADVFMARFARERSRVPAAGERIRLALSGNHCQGTLFRDGAELLTPSLARAIDALATGFGGGDPSAALDFGRFDLRYESAEALGRGEGFAVVELNGATGESTNLYDPRRGLLWSYRVLFGQWRLLYELGAARRDAGARPMSRRELLRAVRSHYRERRGSALAD